MALTHAQPGEVVPALPPDSSETTRPHALFKGANLEVVRLVLRAGDRLPPHKVPGEITVQCVAGRIALTHPGGTATLDVGQLVYLEGGAIHDVLALQDCVAIVTIALPPTGPA
jgi:quercetin dioxygenase-like cupin family protein